MLKRPAFPTSIFAPSAKTPIDENKLSAAAHAITNR